MTLNLKSHCQSAAKAGTWMFIGSIEIFVTTYAVTHNASEALGVVGVYCVTKPAIYYAHERMWNLSFLTKLFH